MDRPAIINKVKEYIGNNTDLYTIAKWIINTEIAKHAPVELDDLSDNAVVADEIEAVVECLQETDYEDAINIAEDSAVQILQEEGFDV